MSGLVLAIDTAAARCAACVYDPSDGVVLARADPEIGRGHAERLMDILSSVLAEASAEFADIGKIAVTVGPGSFTGLRVGVAAARGLALARGVPAVGVSTLEALAEPHLDRGDPVLAVIDAKRGELYAALYGATGACLLEPAAVAPEDLAGRIGALGLQGPMTLVGTGATIAAAILDRARIGTVREDVTCDIAVVARLGAARPAGHAPVPLYLRGPDAKAQANAAIARAEHEVAVP
ncbi:tRNA (adenosine(37)-N6)-threonylcarbamoyltransferase complex dimerization subunit type 1 TsaB [Consotaella aegiceratis]|uniref:tRNA (adenosine(37)-N6)-threonylcarbamoyltransferase complex dimerization subunit type 1 TsaB n=1 Tax=Consotaella aegiceratis TaxID=3097961 RepID=UPI002F4280AF